MWQSFEPVLSLHMCQVLGKLASNCRTHEDRERMVVSGVPRLVVRLMGWARDHGDEAVMLQVGRRFPAHGLS